MTATYEKIATTTLGSSASNIEFTSISGSYTDIVLVVNAKSVSGGVDLSMQVNGDTGSNYSKTNLYGDGSSAVSSRVTNQTSFGVNLAGYVNSTFVSNQIVQLMNYSNSTTYKTFLSRANNANVGTDAITGLWRSTAAITSIKLLVSGDNFASGTMATIYGIKAA